MGKQKNVSPLMVLVRSVLVSLGVYVGGLALLALLLVRGVTGEGTVFVVTAALCGVAAMVGGLLCGRRLLWGVMVNSMSGAVGFGAVLLVTCLCAWEGNPGVDSAVLAGCVLMGGAVAGIVCGGKKKRGGRRVKRR